MQVIDAIAFLNPSNKRRTFNGTPSITDKQQRNHKRSHHSQCVSRKLGKISVFIVKPIQKSAVITETFNVKRVWGGGGGVSRNVSLKISIHAAMI